jgi:pimeloyl-ACP methyl ester carboxylesterase
LDLPSHFNSEYFSKVSLDLYLDAVLSLVDHFSYPEVILCGHSLGGAIAQAYYFKYPNDLKALILCGTGARLRVAPIILEATQNNFEEYLSTIPRGAFSKKTSKDIINEYVNDVSKMKNVVVYADFKICDTFDTMDLTSKIHIPCLIICGSKDLLTPLKYSQYFKEKITNSKLVIIKNAAHMVMLEKPDEVNKVINDFIIQL